MLLFLHFNIELAAEIRGSPLEQSFLEPHVQQVVYGIIFTVAVTSTIAFDLLLDMFMENRFAPIPDQLERLLMILVVIIPSFFILKYSHSPEIPYIFCCLHTIQVVGSIAPIYSLCMKLVPAHFHAKKVLTGYFFWAAAGTFMFIGFHQPLKSWSNISVFVCVFISQIILFDMIGRCCTDVWSRIPPKSERDPDKSVVKYAVEVMTENEICCFFYLTCTLLTIVIVPAITGAIRLYKWEFWGMKDLLFNIYSLAAFSVFPSAIPARVRQHNARTEVQDRIKANHTTVRYISHEIRSPLNIIKSGISFVLDEIKGTASRAVVDMLTDVQDASGAATCIADELLNLGEIEAGTFKVKKELKPASVLSLMVKRCRVLALQKNINFTIRNHFQESSTNESFAVLIDPLKMDQVFRNLLVNSVKFTPPQGSIFVDFKFEPLDSNASVALATPTSFRWGKLRKKISECSSREKIHPVENNSWKSDNRKTIYKQKIEDTPVGLICIDITDTGVGMTEPQCNNVLGEVQPFNATDLEGGGGSGLGMWICKEIVRMHEGTIEFKSSGLNKGTTFSIRLNCYEWDQQIVPLTPQIFTETQTQDGHLYNSFSAIRYDASCRTPASKARGFFGSSDEYEGCELETAEVKSPSPLNILRCRTQTTHLTRFFSFVDENEESGLETNENKKHIDIMVLIVDDSALNRKVVKKCVQKAVETLQGKDKDIQVQIFEADDGTSALQLVTHNPAQFRLILMDNIMAEMNGPQASEKMRTAGYTGLIIGVTGNVTEQDISDFKEHGADDVLEKPVSLQKMTSLIGSLCQ